MTRKRSWSVRKENLVIAGGEKIEKGNDRPLEFGSPASVEGSGAEGLPDNGLADVGGDEEGNSRSETVAFAHELVNQGDNNSSKKELANRTNGKC